MKTKHTPGPWKVSRLHGGKVVAESVAQDICLMFGVAPGMPGSDDANIALVAAAPDLLQGLIDAEEILSAIDRRMPEGLIDKPTLTCIRAAIAKATGEHQ